MFNPFRHPICFNGIHRIAPSTWIGHTPFALLLTDILRPQIIVELGTYYGTSYCAFCQAVDQLNLDTKCYAIDTWQGDSQSGFFGNEVLEDLKNYHDGLYGRFSRLIQSTFDEALAHFDDKSIDLLHIDGFHTYEQVKKDYARWLPKTSERAIILFHDINVKEKDFGVWQFWGEIKSEYPSFEFIHSHGLGILAVGKHCPTAVLDFLSFANDNYAPTQNFFYQLGLRFEANLEIRSLRHALSVRANEIDLSVEKEKRLRDENLQSKLDDIQKVERDFQIKSEMLAKKEEELQSKANIIQKIEHELLSKSEILTVEKSDLQDNEARANLLSQLLQALQKKELDLQNKEKATSESQELIARRLEESEQKSFELEAEKLSIESRRKELLSENQNLFAKRLEIQKILTRLNSNFDADKVFELLDAKFGDVGSSPQNQIPKLMIGIVTYNNSEQQINQLIKSIKTAVNHINELSVKVEILVIDNGQETFWSDSELVIGKFDSLGNVGFGKGMNRLMSEAFADQQVQWYLCLNPDGVMHYQTLNELIKVAKLHPQSLLESRQFPEEHLKTYDFQTLETPWASGACLLISRQIYESIGGFDPNFFMYLEDVDFSWRARSAGFNIKFIPNSIFGHSVLDRQFDAKTDQYMLLSGRYLAAKWGNDEFRRWAETELIQRGYCPSIAELPKLPKLPDIAGVGKNVSDFDHYFYFSSPRW